MTLTPINKWVGRISNFDRNERFIIQSCLQQQVLYGKRMVSTLKVSLPPPKDGHTIKKEIEAKIDPCTFLAEELWRQIHQRLKWLVERLQSERFQIKVWCGWGFRGYYNSLGSDMTSSFPLSKLKVSVQVAEDVLIKRTGMRQGLEFFDNIPNTMVKDFLHDVQQAKIAKQSELIPKVIILDPEAMSMFIHETVGHSSESDNVQFGESYPPAFRGKPIAPPEITLAAKNVSRLERVNV